MRPNHMSSLLISGLLLAGGARADAVSDLVAEYKAAGAGPFSAAAGATFWRQEHPASDGAARSCQTCHTTDLRHAGKHAVTGKRIDPLGPSVNRERLTKTTQIEKWLGRNCKWTLGRECTAQEKGDVLSFLQTQ
jgi:hypothetical protein